MAREAEQAAVPVSTDRDFLQHVIAQRSRHCHLRPKKDLHQQLIHSTSAMCTLSKTAFPPLSYKPVHKSSGLVFKQCHPKACSAIKEPTNQLSFPLTSFLTLSPVSVSLQCLKKLQSIKSSEMRDPNVSSSYMPW